MYVFLLFQVILFIILCILSSYLYIQLSIYTLIK